MMQATPNSMPHSKTVVGALVFTATLVVLASKSKPLNELTSNSSFHLRQYALPAFHRDEKARPYRQMEMEGGGYHRNLNAVDCSVVSQTNEDDGGMYVHTTTEPSFLMSLRDPSIDTSVSLEIEMTGVFEGHLVNGLISALEEAGPTSLFIDVGSNCMGMYSLAAAAKEHDVLAFEPLRMNWRTICNTINSNEGFENRISVYEAAVVDRPKPVVIGDATMLSREDVAAPVAPSDGHEGTTEGVDYAWGVSLDSMQDDLPLDRPIAIRLDLRTVKCEAFAGGQKYLAKADLVYVQMEVLQDSFENCQKAQEAIDLLVAKGLEPIFYDVPGSDSFRQLDPKNWKNWFDESNFFVTGNIVWRKRARLPAENTQQHLVDCSMISSTKEAEEDGGLYVKTMTFPPFLMNTHDPKVDTLISGEIKKKRVFEAHLVHEFERELKRSGPDAFIIDIGGNIGMYGLLGPSTGHEAISFEPLEMNWRRMCNSVNANDGFEEYLTVYAAAVVEQPKLVSLEGFDRSNPGHVVAQNEVAHGVATKKKKGLDFAAGISLDSIMDDLPLERPIFMKLDIEGGECRALTGGLEYLAKADLTYLQMEVTPDTFAHCPRAQEVIDVLVEKGLKPVFFDKPGFSFFKQLDPRSWRQWFDDKPGWEMGHIVWKKKLW